MRLSDLTPYAQSCILATNMWRVAGGMPVIEVPKENTEYWNRWNGERMQAKGEAILKERKRLNAGYKL